jgi:hypothetical protein
LDSDLTVQKKGEKKGRRWSPALGFRRAHGDEVDGDDVAGALGGIGGVDEVQLVKVMMMARSEWSISFCKGAEVRLEREAASVRCRQGQTRWFYALKKISEGFRRCARTREGERTGRRRHYLAVMVESEEEWWRH